MEVGEKDMPGAGKKDLFGFEAAVAASLSMDKY